MDIYSIDIDKFISWYKEQSEFVHYLEDYRIKMKRYLLTSFDCHTRFIKNQNNLISKALSEKLHVKAAELEQRVKDAEIDKDLFYYPSPREWVTIELLSKDDYDLIEIERRLSFVKDEAKDHVLKELRAEYVSNWESPFKDRYLKVKAIPKIEGLPSAVVSVLGLDFQHIKTIQYLDGLINGSEQKTLQPNGIKNNMPPVLNKHAYKISNIQFVELAKALYIELAPDETQVQFFNGLASFFNLDITDKEWYEKTQDIKRRTKSNTIYLDRLRKNIKGLCE